ncbi:type III secretion system apparatus protein VscT2 [Vibrio aestuarianus]|uniref:type III secretion system apparatus protein VscT2 n=1 Tax=Vibrio aestuarianus TaxID=28171 RepID=UPI004068FC9E
MAQLLFPNWMLFAGVYLFLKIYSPTRLYLDNIACLAIATVFAIFLEHTHLKQVPNFIWVVSVVIFAFFSSVPYWVSGTVGSVIQQMLLLNEQSVQDSRFTDESEALAKMSSLLFLMCALESGAVFYPILDLINKSLESQLEIGFEDLFFLIVDSLKMMVIVSGKYMILMLTITVCCGYIDLFFKKASLSLFVTPNLKAIVVVLLLNLWFFHDQFYVFKQMMEKMGYE